MPVLAHAVAHETTPFWIQLIAPTVALAIAVWGFVWDVLKRRQDRLHQVEVEDARALTRARRVRYSKVSNTSTGGTARMGITTTNFTVMNTDTRPIYDVTVGPVWLRDAPEGTYWQGDPPTNGSRQVIAGGKDEDFPGTWMGHNSVDGVPQAGADANVSPMISWTDADGRAFRRAQGGTVSEVK